MVFTPAAQHYATQVFAVHAPLVPIVTFCNSALLLTQLIPYTETLSLGSHISGVSLCLRIEPFANNVHDSTNVMVDMGSYGKSCDVSRISSLLVSIVLLSHFCVHLASYPGHVGG